VIAVPSICNAFVAREEGCSLRAYRDSGGVWTIGVGHVGGVRPGEIITQAEADAWLSRDLQEAVYRLSLVVEPKPLGALNAYQLSAILSFVFNVGAVSTWPIWKAVNAGDHAATLAHLQLYTRDSSGDVVPGLVNRRKAEIALYNGVDPLCAQFPLAGSAAIPAPAATGVG
jgi:lysozyme